MKESLQRAFAYLQSQKGKLGVGQQFDTTDFHVEAIDLLSNHVPCEAGIAGCRSLQCLQAAIRIGRAGDTRRSKHPRQHQGSAYTRRNRFR